MENKAVYAYPHYRFDADKDTVRKIKQDDRFHRSENKNGMEYHAKSDDGLAVSIYSGDKDTQMTSVYFQGKGSAEIGAFYRRMTLENKKTPVDNLVKKDNERGGQAEEIAYNTLNFKCDVVGSDETGKSETFKETIVVAAYIKPGKKHMDALLKLNVNDSKKMVKTGAKNPQKRLNEVGKELLSDTRNGSPTIKSYADLKEKLKEKDGVCLVKTEHLIICVTRYSNKDYNNCVHDFNTQLTDLHGKVIKELLKNIEVDEKTYIVTDDFYGERKTDGNRMRLVKELNDLGYSQVISTTEADANVIAVSCASVISTYLQNLYLEELADHYKLDYNDIFMGTIAEDIYHEVKSGKFSLEEEKALSAKPFKSSQEEYYRSIEAFMNKLLEKGDDVLADFFDKYAKRPKSMKHSRRKAN